MSQFYTNVVSLLHANLNLDGLNKAEVTKAKRANIVANGDNAAVDTAAALHEKGIEAKWLCPDGKLIPVDTLAKVSDLVESGADVTELQKFSPSEILAGLNDEQLASLKPVEVVTEAEAAVAQVEVETAPVEVKEIETWTCTVTGETRPVDKMLVLKLGLLDSKLGHRTTEVDLRTHAVSAKGAMKQDLNRANLMLLDVALDLVRKEEARSAASKQKVEAEKTARIQEDAAFRKQVFVGQPKAHPRTGKVHVRCVQGRGCEYAMEKGTAFVGPTDVMQAPSLEDMQLLNYEALRGKVVDVSQLMAIYALCPKCATKFIENPQSVAKAEKEILGDLEVNAAVYADETEQDKLHRAFYNSAQAKQQPRRFEKKGNRRG